ncbi:fibronectin type III domain-containing protein [Lysinibacillus halotolerans]
MKKIFLGLFLVGLIMPLFTGKASAHTDGYFDLFPSKSLIPIITNNDIADSYMLPGGKTITITNSMDNEKVTYVWLKTGYNPNIAIEFLDDSGTVIKSLGVTSSVWTPVNVENVVTIQLHNTKSEQTGIVEFDVKTEEMHLDYHPHTNVNGTANSNTINLSWENPTPADFYKTIIKVDGVEVARVDESVTSYSLKDLEYEKEYNIQLIALYLDGNTRMSNSFSVITGSRLPESSGDITNLLYEAKYDQVKLEYKLPTSTNLKTIKVYRDDVLIKETNESSFIDLDVKPNTEYIYKITTVSTDDIESQGVLTTVKTPLPPPPKIEGGGYEKDPSTGNYTYYWEEPTTGKVKVLIDGQLYATVNASDKQIVIPMKDMKFDIWGTPKVELIPVSEDGKEGEAVKPPSQDGTGGLGEVEVPFGPSDLITISTGLFWLVGAFVLLALSFLVVPKLRNTIVSALGKKEKIPKEERVRREREERVRKERPSREVRERKEPRVRTVRVSTREQRQPRLRGHRERLTRAERKG